MHYDGKSKLADAIADLYGYSPRNHNKIAELIQQAKTGLGITGKARVMSDEIKQDIYRWLSERLNLIQNTKNQIDLFQAVDERIAIPRQRVLTCNSPVQIVKPDKAIQDVKQITRQQGGNNGLNPHDFEQLHFGVTIIHQGQPKRTTIMLEGYWVKALQRKHGLANNATIRTWIEQEMKADGGKFDSHEALTKQVKRMMIESFV